MQSPSVQVDKGKKLVKYFPRCTMKFGEMVTLQPLPLKFINKNKVHHQFAIGSNNVRSDTLACMNLLVGW